MNQSDISHTQNNITEYNQVGEDLYAILVERAQDGIIAIQDSKLRFVNSKFTQMTGYDVSDLIGQTILMVASQNSVDFIEQRKQDLLTGKELVNMYNMDILTHQGQVISVEANFALIEYQDELMDLLILREISERSISGPPAKPVMEEYINPGKWPEYIMKSTPNLITVIDPNGMIQFANNPLGDNWKAELEGTSLYDYVDPDHRAVAASTIENVCKTGEPDHFVIRVRNPSGVTIWSETLVGPVTENDEVIALTLISTDITKRKLREQRVEEKAQEVEVRSYELEAANSEMQQNQMQLLEINEKLIASQGKLAETISNLKEAQVHPSTPILQVWDKILVLPLHGIKDSLQARDMMEMLVSKVTETETETVILDVTGITSVDNFMARIISQTISMIEMLGVKITMSGLEPEIALALKGYGLNVGETGTDTHRI